MNFFTCVAGCVARIPWWAWLVVAIAGAVIGALTYIFGVVTGPGGIVVNALLKAMLIGALGGVAATFGYCLLGCARAG